MTVTATNRISGAGFVYDAAGNLISDGTNTYSYDAEGNLIQQSSGGTTIQNTYDALNHQVAEVFSSLPSNFQQEVFDKSGQLASVWYPNATTQILGKAYWGATPIESYSVSANMAYFAHRDWVGTRRVITNAAGATTDLRQSLPFGDGAANIFGSQDNTFDGFTGLWAGGSIATNHAQFREYSNTAGRWLQPDPYSGSYRLENPQSYNRYAYVLNNPLAKIDPLGLDECSAPTGDGGDDGDDGGCGGDDGGGGGGNPSPCVDSGTSVCVTGTPDPVDCTDNLDPTLCESPSSGPIESPTQSTPGGGAPNNGQEPPPACQAKILSATNNQFGTNYTDANVSNTFNYSTGAGPGQGTLNLNITGSTAGVSPGYYPVHWYSYIIGYGPTLHVVSGPGGNGGLDSQMTVPFGPNQGTFHIDSAFPHNPFGAIIHGIMNMTKLAGYPKC